MEMRGADSGRWRKLCALPALWTGIFYDQTALDAAYDLIRDWSTQERQMLRDEVPKTALKTKFRSGALHDVSRQMLAISSAGLKARGRRNDANDDERIYLGPIEEIVEEGRTRAERLLDRYYNEWNCDIDQLFMHQAY
jgi:glutamate--cysteine ligase